ncbi:hypothetical protein SAMN05660657_03658 [Geodermatophilus amargosae]|uniref:Uncharacterized protein n=1 Tax=Geodermatophilus amargosae TaxID=1296565 RepID=A0A1I7BK42_9ACTN|nr:hypothetical protein [Geodermatophilus amargosae]SFT87548.1 hypothetical protein SAMN05660657_03658 [Geodermatophilus amargosae]
MPVCPFLKPLPAGYPQVPQNIPDHPASRAEPAVQVEVTATQLAEPGPEVGKRRRITIPVGSSADEEDRRSASCGHGVERGPSTA